MSNLIDRQAMLERIEKTRQDAYMMDDIHRGTLLLFGMDLLEEAVMNQPSAQPEAKPPKLVAEDRYIKNHFKVFPHCPQCNAEVTTGQCYCMICGQHIDWSEDDE